MDPSSGILDYNCGSRTYNGHNSEASAEIKDWFEALNREYRYQLTPIGGAALIYIAEEINNGSFKIAREKPIMKGSWQVTGIHQDA